jgi:hypothetical protein
VERGGGKRREKRGERRRERRGEYTDTRVHTSI